MSRIIPITTAGHAPSGSPPPLPERFAPVRMSITGPSTTAAAGPSAPGGSPIALASRLSLEVEVIAESLYQANCLLNANPDPFVPFNALHPVVRASYRDAAIVSLQRIVPTAHETALRIAEALAPNFGAALAFYLNALLRASMPVHPAVHPPEDR